ncbi:peptidoglycan-binding protein [Streptomyces sp. NPDC101234]|uniref:peptidoglycan-binding protein n=1 Tax=Streptomyces sp. NPDC101234 TaxID=3366138 RepID=UPI0037F289A1
MARWKELPGGLDPVVVEFVGQLRRLKDGSGLSLPRLAVRTGYSASSWERYLSGRLLPPAPAVEALAAVTGADTVRLLALHEAAADSWHRDRPAGPADLDAESGGEPPPITVAPSPVRRPVTRLRLYLTAAGAAVAGAAIAGAAVTAVDGERPADSSRTVAVAHPITYACTYVRKAGSWYAGNSGTNSDLLEVDMSGPEVAELQCLLQRAGISPGGVDGNFGPLTESAVITAQKRYHLDIDGQVGPHTWAALRG